MDAVMAAPDAPPPSVVLVSAGASHSVALLSGNMLCSWGRGEDGQLGHGDAEDRLVPTVLSGFDAPGITLVICGADHTTAYSEDERQVYSWGWGDFGRLGHGNSSDVFTPQPVKALQGLKIKQIACGDSHCLAVTMDGEVHRHCRGGRSLGSCREGIRLAAEWTRSKAILESDCATLISALSSEHVPRLSLFFVLREIRDFISGLPELKFQAVRREQNSVAHELAQLAKRTIHTAMWRAQVPQCSSQLVAYDCNSIVV